MSSEGERKYFYTEEYVANLVELYPTDERWRGIKGMDLYSYMASYGVKQPMVNLNAFLVQQGMPAHYTMARMRDTLYTFRYTENFPPEAPLEIFVDSRKSTKDAVDAVVSVLQSTAHLTEEVFEEAKKKDGLVYYRPKLNGVYSWSIDFGKLGSVMIGHNGAFVAGSGTFGYSFEKVSGMVRVPLAVAHMSDHINGFPSISSLEAAFGPQTECVVGVRLNGMLCEFKVKDTPTFELHVRQGGVYDFEGSSYGSTDYPDGIYEVAITLRDGLTRVQVIRLREDKMRPQSGTVVRAALAGPRYSAMRSIDIDAGRVVIGSVSVGVGKEDAPAESLHNCDVFLAGPLVKQRPWREMLAYFAANHVRMVGQLLQVSPCVSVPSKVLHHRSMSGGSLGAFLTTYRGFDFLHPYFPQAFLQTLYSLACTLLQVGTNYQDNVRYFMLAVDAARFGINPSSRNVTFFSDVVVPYVDIYMGRLKRSFAISNPSMLRLVNVLEYNVKLKGAGGSYWNIPLNARCIRFYQKPYDKRYIDWSLFVLQEWDGTEVALKTQKRAQTFALKKRAAMMKQANRGSIMSDWTQDLMNPIVLGFHNPAVLGCVFMWEYDVKVAPEWHGPYFTEDQSLWRDMPAPSSDLRAT
jgi:hypothetical protein